MAKQYKLLETNLGRRSGELEKITKVFQQLELRMSQLQ
jgi:hypothetical protein